MGGTGGTGSPRALGVGEPQNPWGWQAEGTRDVTDAQIALKMTRGMSLLAPGDPHTSQTLPGHGTGRAGGPSATSCPQKGPLEQREPRGCEQPPSPP